MFSALNPLAAMFWGYLILSEPLRPAKLIGAALILIGILLPMFDKGAVLKNHKTRNA